MHSDNTYGGNSRGAMSRDCETDREPAAGPIFVQLGVFTMRGGDLSFRWDRGKCAVFA